MAGVKVAAAAGGGGPRGCGVAATIRSSQSEAVRGDVGVFPQGKERVVSVGI